MAKSKKKYYAIARGQKPGLYKTWPEAEVQVKNFNGAVYKGFYDLDDALAYLSEHNIHVPEHDNRPKKETPKNCVLIYTDGGAIGNPGPGGYGVVLSFDGHRKELSQGFKKTTNNRMELMACIAGLTALKNPVEVIVYSDSKYVVDGMNEGWARQWRINGWKKKDGKPVENADLWKKLLDAVKRHHVKFVWVKGHAGKKENERCDQLVQQASRSKNQEQDSGYMAAKNTTLFSL